MAALLLRDVTRRPLRSVFTIMGVAAAAAAYTLLVGSVSSFVHQFHDLSPMFGADLVVQQAGAPTPFASALPAGLAGPIGDTPGVVAASGLGISRARAFKSDWCLVLWLDPLGKLAPRIPIVRGGPLAPGGHGILLGERVAARTGLAPGSEMELRGSKFRVSGVFATQHAFLDGALVVASEDGQRLFNVGDGVNVVLADLAPGADPAGVAAEIARRFPGTEVTRIAEYVRTVGLLRIVAGFARLIALVAVVIAALGTASVLSLSVQERTQEIAVLRAVGWRRRRIAALIVGEGLIVSLAGGVAAVPLSAVTLLLLRHFGPGADIGLLPASLLVPGGFEALAVTALAGMAGAALPAARALGVPPATAFRST
jgi:putative ABC transport system permease protein